MRWYDHSTAAAYLVTIRTRDRAPVLGRLTRDGADLNEEGRIVEATLAEFHDPCDGATIDGFVVAPDAVHAIVVLRGSPSRPVGLTAVIRGLKTASSRRINERRGAREASLWQRGFEERIIRDEASLERCRRYVEVEAIRAGPEPEGT